MEHEALLDVYEKLSQLAQANDEAGAKKLLRERFAELPEDVQAQILTRLYFSALDRQNEEAITLAQIQENALSALEALEILQQKLEAEGVDKA